MPALHSYDYAIIRLTPRLERGESINVGVVLYCRTKRFLAAPTHLDTVRVHALDATCDLSVIRDQLALFSAVARGDHDAGPIATLPQPERFHWLVAPRSTIIYAAPVHCGLTEDPQHLLDRLMFQLVL
ncbi:MAG: DUF3037 domain-containing protein [Roseiflexaceae bacterium]